MNKKKILFFHPSPYINGAGLSGLNLLHAIPEDSYDKVIYCNSSYGGSMADMFENSGYKVIRGNRSPVVFLHFSGGRLFALSIRAIVNYLKILYDYKSIENIIIEQKPDIIVVNSMTLFWIGKLASKYHAEAICFFRETYIRGFIGIRNRVIKRFLSKYFDKIAFLSRFDLEQNKKVKSKKTVIYNSISKRLDHIAEKDKILKRLRLDDSRFKILFLGGMVPIKGALVLLKALKYLKDLDFTLVFVGYEWNGRRKMLKDGKTFEEKLSFILGLDYEKKCINFILKNEVSDKIRFFSAQPDIDLFYSVCDALVFPATKPHQARPVFEAGYARIPLIISRFPNISEFADDSSAYMFENKNYKQLAGIIRQVIKNPDDSLSKIEVNYNHCIKNHLPGIYEQRVKDFLMDQDRSSQN